MSVTDIDQVHNLILVDQPKNSWDTEITRQGMEFISFEQLGVKKISAKMAKSQPSGGQNA